MISYKIEMKKFKEVNIYDLLNEIGIYFLWDSQAKRRVTYIGEGDVISRLASHSKKFPILNGYIGFIHEGKKSKQISQLFEAAFIHIGREKDRLQDYNSSKGHGHIVKELCLKSNKIKLYVSGYDPFMPPKHPMKINGNKLIDIILIDDKPDYIYDWKMRKITPTVIDGWF